MSRAYQVIAADMASPTTLVLTLYCTDRSRPIHYKPGQYATISFKRHGRPTPSRCFSITSSPEDRGWLQFGLRVAGNFTQAAAKSIKPGDTVTIDGGFGSFVISPMRDRTLVFLAGGIGITPFVSLVRHAANERFQNEILLVYSSKDQNDVPFANELMQLELDNPHLHVVFAISKGAVDRFAGHKAVQGRVTPQLLDGMLGGYYRDKTYFICGPPPFMHSMVDNLVKQRVPKSRIMTEEFSQGIPADTAWLGQPRHIYALTALSMILGTGMVVDQDFVAAATKTAAGFVKTDQSSTTSGSERESIIDQTIGNLISVNGSDGSGRPDSSSVIGSPSTTTTNGSGAVLIGSTGSSNGSTPGNTATTKSPGSSPGSTSPPTPAQLTPVPSPAPTAAGVPVALSLTASSTSIVKGSSVTLAWNTNTNATTPVSCIASGGWSGAKAASGSTTISPTSTATYSLACSNAAGGSSKSVTVTVTTPTPPPPAKPPPPPPPPPSGGS